MAVKMILTALLLLGNLARGASPTAPSPQLSISYGDTSLSANQTILDLGSLPADKLLAIELKLKNLSKQPVTLDLFSLSPDATVVWTSPNDAHGLLTRTTLKGNEEASFKVSILPNIESKTLPTITVMNAGTQFHLLGIMYAAEPSVVTQSLQTIVSSGYASESQSYEPCLGPSPKGYTLKLGSVRLEAQSLSPQHARSCGYYMDCDPPQADDANVCMKVRIQGHFKGGTMTSPTEKEIFPVQIKLLADYVPKSSEIKLIEMPADSINSSASASTANH